MSSFQKVGTDGCEGSKLPSLMPGVRGEEIRQFGAWDRSTCGCDPALPILASDLTFLGKGACSTTLDTLGLSV